MSIVLMFIMISFVVLLFLNLVYLEFPSFAVIRKMKKLKGPNGLPLYIGEMWNLMKLQADDVLEYFETQYKLYNRISAFFVSGIPMIVLFKPADVKHVLSSSKHIKKGIEYGPVMAWLNEGLLTSYGTKWHTRRKMLTPTFHFKIVKDSLSQMVTNTNILANKLCQTNGEDVNVLNYVSLCSLDIMAETAMGVQLNNQTGQGNQYLRTVKEVSELILYRVLSIYLIKDLFFNVSLTGLKFYKALKTLRNFTDKVISARKEILNITSYEDINKDAEKKGFLDSLIFMQKENPNIFTDKDIREEVDTFMFEGHDTTSSALTFGLWLLGCNSNVQEIIYQEIIDNIEDGQININNINNLNYLERVIKEILRLYPSVPYISRRLAEDLILDDGTVIPEGANVGMLPYLLHRDPENFPDPEKFDPDRFLEEESVGRHPYVYIPFSAGPRNCIGQKFAMLELKITLASIVRKCRIKAVTKVEDFKIKPTLIISPTTPLICKFKPRPECLK